MDEEWSICEIRHTFSKNVCEHKLENYTVLKRWKILTTGLSMISLLIIFAFGCDVSYLYSRYLIMPIKFLMFKEEKKTMDLLLYKTTNLEENLFRH